MELWIRSQNKEILSSFKNVFIDEDDCIMGCSGNWKQFLGRYNSKERALKVLNEIQEKIKNPIILKYKGMLTATDLMKAKNELDYINHEDFIVCDNHFDVIPLNGQVILYEMPQE